MTNSPVTIRGYRPTDHAALHEICIRTGHVGEDASDRFKDPAILPAIFAEPYAELEPELVFVADDGERVLGYIVGTADSTRFFAEFRERWLPTVAERFPAPVGEPADADEHLRHLLHHAELMLVPEIAAEFPAHLHIDLLPPGQGRGLGRRLMTAFLDALRERGVPGVHLGMNPANTRARAFYDRLGFVPLRQVDPTHHLGMRLG
ncbi:GNAT family N-acetyltransferase [Streptomyces millisiae]|uniref:GNAT family N-acetyltransferase n=1 Tax=Streptomyces millisiae TaxID=3075542 RepID=A0ABU2LTI0_9ACTN|nr:GNAT family N-acetyltransferase [Streptomyces sp. DSM 44918]MDT0320487.1 GNAT family N-acetyltransferase [Streptomyces sp. DSM 44918]